MNIAYICDQIRSHTIEPPKDLNADQLTEWLIGYRTCLTDTLNILRDIQEQGENA